MGSADGWVRHRRQESMSVETPRGCAGAMEKSTKITLQCRGSHRGDPVHLKEYIRCSEEGPCEPLLHSLALPYTSLELTQLDRQRHLCHKQDPLI